MSLSIGSPARMGPRGAIERFWQRRANGRRKFFNPHVVRAAGFTCALPRQMLAALLLMLVAPG
jgi:hypothetical protein